MTSSCMHTSNSMCLGRSGDDLRPQRLPCVVIALAVPGQSLLFKQRPGRSGHIQAQEFGDTPGNSLARTAVPLAVVSERTLRNDAYSSPSYQSLKVSADGNRTTTAWPGAVPSRRRVLPEATITSPPTAASDSATPGTYSRSYRSESVMS